MLEFWRFTSVNLDTYTLLVAELNYSLIFVSIFIAALAAYASLVVLERAWASNNHKSKQLWLVFGALVMGTGVWAMHFTGMLAYMVPVTMSYSLGLTTLSAFPAICGAFYALNEMSKFHFSFIQMQLSSLSLALGIGCMHFIGMEAMQTSALMTYDLSLFLLSLLAAHLLALIALYIIVFSYRAETNKQLIKIISAVVMGAAISGMHYIATASVSFFTLDISITHVHNTTLGLSFGIATVVVIFVATTVLCSIVEQRFDDSALLALQSSIREKDIIEHMADGLLVIQCSETAVLANSAIRKMFMYSEESKSSCNLDQLIPGYNYQNLVEDSFLDPPKILNNMITIEGVKSNGDIFPIEARFTNMPVLVGTDLMFNCIVSDISTKVELEIQLRQAQKLESMGQLAAGIAHEINTPTQFVSDNTTFLKEAFDGCLKALNKSQNLTSKALTQVNEEEWDALKKEIEASDLDFLIEEVPAAFDQSIEGLQRISSIVKAMKSFSHPSKGHAEPADLTEILETTITVARNEWRYISELKTNFDKDLPSILCIRDELSQVFLNIIVNATHAIEELCAQSDKKAGIISITTSQENGYAKITISDDGAGMKAEVKKRMFDPFYTTKDVGKGTGQGLNMAYSVITDKHKGSIRAESELGKGSKFIISLPIVNTYLEETPFEENSEGST